jgi:hypothetical protein
MSTKGKGKSKGTKGKGKSKGTKGKVRVLRQAKRASKVQVC